MQYVVCDSIDVNAITQQTSCIGSHIVEYIPPTNSCSSTAMDAVTIDPLLAARFFMMGFGVIASVLLTTFIIKYLFKEFMKSLPSKH